jgi:hypothetical protein
MVWAEAWLTVLCTHQVSLFFENISYDTYWSFYFNIALAIGSHYFKRHRGLSIGIVASGAGLGMAFMICDAIYWSHCLYHGLLRRRSTPDYAQPSP